MTVSLARSRADKELRQCQILELCRASRCSMLCKDGISLYVNPCHSNWAASDGCACALHNADGGRPAELHRGVAARPGPHRLQAGDRLPGGRAGGRRRHHPGRWPPECGGRAEARMMPWLTTARHPPAPGSGVQDSFSWQCDSVNGSLVWWTSAINCRVPSYGRSWFRCACAYEIHSPQKLSCTVLGKTMLDHDSELRT